VERFGDIDNVLWVFFQNPEDEENEEAEDESEEESEAEESMVS
jgi:hypothetical protein